MQNSKISIKILYSFILVLSLQLLFLPVYNCGNDGLTVIDDDTTQAGNNNGFVTYWTETTDGGLNWDPLDSNYNSDIKTIYAGTKISAIPGLFLMCGKDTANNPAIWKSTDYGDTWSMIYHTSANAYFIKMNYNSTGQSILAIMNIGSVVRSSDNGNTWNDLSFPNVVSAMDYDEPTGRWVAVGYFGLAMYSDDGGISWTQSSGIGSVGLDDVCFIENSQTVVTITETAIYRSVDGGVNYVITDNTFNTQYVSISGDGKGIILTNSTNPPYYTTTNAGLNWLAGPVSSSATAYNDVVIFDSNLVLATKISGIVYSTNMGETWNSTGISKEMYEINRTDHTSRYAFVLGK